MSKTNASGISAAERVYGEVKELILTNRLSGGELLSEGEIATRCEVSRTPVREAFLRLEAEGWMRLYPKRGALVVPISEHDAADVIEARILLEGHAIRSVSTDATALAALVARLRDNLDTHRDVDPTDVEQYSRLDAEFHQLIAAAGNNALLSGFFASLGERHRRMTTTSVHRDSGVAELISCDHAELIEVIDRGDADGFVEVLTRHLAAVHDLRLGGRS